MNNMYSTEVCDTHEHICQFVFNNSNLNTELKTSIIDRLINIKEIPDRVCKQFISDKLNEFFLKNKIDNSYYNCYYKIINNCINSDNPLKTLEEGKTFYDSIYDNLANFLAINKDLKSEIELLKQKNTYRFIYLAIKLYENYGFDIQLKPFLSTEYSYKSPYLGELTKLDTSKYREDNNIFNEINKRKITTQNEETSEERVITILKKAVEKNL